MKTDCADSDCLGQQCQSSATQNVCTAVSTCACGIGPQVVLTTSDNASGYGRLVDLGGRLRAVWATRNNVHYAECVSGCGTATPTWSTQISLAPKVSNNEVRPELRLLANGTLAASMHYGADVLDGGVHYAECPSGQNCALLSSWHGVDFGPAHDDVATLDVLGSLRALVWEAPSSQLGYAECQGACDQPASWSTVMMTGTISGGSLKLSSQADGGILRALFVGDSTNNPEYRECGGPVGACLTQAAWTERVLTVGATQNPDMVLDHNGLPRVFGEDPLSAQLVMLRCLSRPCTTLANWSGKVPLIDGGYSISAGTLSDGGTYFYGHDGAFTMSLGTELADGGYAVRPVLDCSGLPVFGNSGAAFPNGNGRFGLVFSENRLTPLRFRQQLP